MAEQQGQSLDDVALTVGHIVLDTAWRIRQLQAALAATQNRLAQLEQAAAKEPVS